MKKALFATTALVAGALATPQVASAQSVSAGNADIKFGGYARWGLSYDDTNDTNVTSRYRLQVDATTESDGGVTYGARARIQVNNGAAGGTTNAARFFIRTGGLEVGFGNIQGAIEFMPGQYPIDLGLTGLGYDYTAFGTGGADAYDSGGAGAAGGNPIEVIYNAGDLGVHFSTSENNDRTALVVDFTVAGFTLAAGFQDSSSDADTEFTVSAGGDIGPASVTFAYADNGTGGDHIVLAGGFDVSASTNVEAYFASAEDSFSDDNSFGVDFNQSLGGGVSFRGGVAKRGNGDTAADLGVRFNF